MKSFTSYLMESEKTYSFRIKIAGEVDNDRIDALETALEKYELKSLSKPKKTPIQEHPMDFQTLSNSEVNIMDAEVNYPVTAHQLYEYLTQKGCCEAPHLVVINKNHPEEIAREESLKGDEEYTSKLEDADYKDADNVKTEEVFGDTYNENMLKSLETRKYEFAKKE